MSESMVSKEISKKLDKIQEDMSEVKIKVAKIETTLENQPELDEAKHSKIEQKVDDHNKRLNNLESNQKWVVIAILGIVINAVMQLILH